MCLLYLYGGTVHHLNGEHRINILPFFLSFIFILLQLSVVVQTKFKQFPKLQSNFFFALSLYRLFLLLQFLLLYLMYYMSTMPYMTRTKFSTQADKQKVKAGKNKVKTFFSLLFKLFSFFIFLLNKLFLFVFLIFLLFFCFPLMQEWFNRNRGDGSWEVPRSRDLSLGGQHSPLALHISSHCATKQKNDRYDGKSFRWVQLWH